MLVVEMMTNKIEGYKVVANVNTVEEAKEVIAKAREQYNVIDIYFTCA